MTDLDPLLHDAMAHVRGPVDARPSLTDVRRRARRHNQRRLTATVGVVACTGVATAALIVRRDSAAPSTAGSAPSDAVDAPPTSSAYQPSDLSTTTMFGLPSMTVTASAVWDALRNVRFDPSGVGLVVEPVDQAAADVMPTPEQFGCTSPECRAMYNYVIWHEFAGELGFTDVFQMQNMNSAIDFSQPPRAGDVLRSVLSSFSEPPTTNPNDETPTTISLFDGVLLIDGGAPAGAMEDAYQRLAGYNRTIVPGSGKTVEQTLLMPIGDNAPMASAVGEVLGLDGFDTYDNSFLGSPIQGMVAVVIGPDYWDRVPPPPRSRPPPRRPRTRKPPADTAGRRFTAPRGS